MHYEFKKNGEISLTLKPDADVIEQAFFDQLFSGEIIFVKQSSANRADEVVIKVKPKEITVSAPVCNFIP